MLTLFAHTFGVVGAVIRWLAFMVGANRPPLLQDGVVTKSEYCAMTTVRYFLQGERSLSRQNAKFMVKIHGENPFILLGSSLGSWCAWK